MEAVLLRCLETEDFDAAVEEACQQHPVHAAKIRRIARRIRHQGLLDAPDSPPPPAFPERVGTFRLLRRLGEGGMGVVFEAHDEKLDRRVAVKLVRPELLFFSKGRERFAQEVAAVARLQHPGIVQVFSAGEGEVPHFAMEFVQGRSLADVLHSLRDRHPATLTGKDLFGAGASGDTTVSGRTDLASLSWVDACLRIARELADALDHAHRQGILHRDLKPSNVMLDQHGRPRLLDFGLARADEGQKITRTGSVLGSLPYMAPEQVRGETDRLGPWTDIYGLGVTLFELLALQSPFYCPEDSEETRRRILEARHPPLRKRNRAVPQDVAVVCLKAMAPEPEQRYGTAAELAADLDNLIARRPVRARRAGLLLRARRALQRHPAMALALLVTLVLASVGAAGYGTVEASARRQAERLQEGLERNAYLANIVAANSLLAEGNAAEALASLDRAPAGLRRWEWRHLRARADSSLQTLVPFPDVPPGNGNLTDLDVAADGHTVVVGDPAGHVRTVDLRTGAVLGEWEVGTPARLVAFAGDGDRVVVSSFGSGQCLLLDLRDGSTVPMAESRHFRALAADRRGRKAASGWAALFSGSGGVLVYDLERGAVSHRFESDEHGIYSLAMDPDGRHLLAGTTRGRILAWDLSVPELGEPRTFADERFANHRGMIVDLAVSDDGRRLAAAGSDGQVSVWDVRTGDLLHVMACLQGSVAKLAWVPGRDLLALSDRSGNSVGLCKPSDGPVSIARRGFGHGALITELQIAGDHIVTASQDGTVRTWRADRPGGPTRFRSRPSMRSLAPSVDGRRLVSVSSGGALAVWRTASGEREYLAQLEDTALRQVARHPAEDLFAVAGDPGSLFLFSLDDPEQRLRFSVGGDQALTALAWRPDGQELVSTDSDGRLQRWDRSGRLLGEAALEDPLTCLAFDPGGKTLITGDRRGRLREWSADDLAAISEVADYGRPIQAVAYVPGAAKSIVVASETLELTLWQRSAEGGFVARNLRRGAMMSSLCYHPAEPRLYVGDMFGRVTVYDTGTWSQILSYQAHSKGVLGTAFVTATDSLATTSMDGSIGLWGTGESR